MFKLVQSGINDVKRRIDNLEDKKFDAWTEYARRNYLGALQVFEVVITKYQEIIPLLLSEINQTEINKIKHYREEAEFAIKFCRLHLSDSAVGTLVTSGISTTSLLVINMAICHVATRNVERDIFYPRGEQHLSAILNRGEQDTIISFDIIREIINLQAFREANHRTAIYALYLQELCADRLKWIFHPTYKIYAVLQRGREETDPLVLLATPVHPFQYLGERELDQLKRNPEYTTEHVQYNSINMQYIKFMEILDLGRLVEGFENFRKYFGAFINRQDREAWDHVRKKLPPFLPDSILAREYNLNLELPFPKSPVKSIEYFNRAKYEQWKAHAKKYWLLRGLRLF